MATKARAACFMEWNDICDALSYFVVSAKEEEFREEDACFLEALADDIRNKLEKK